jgi:hypothetical protein
METSSNPVSLLPGAMAYILLIAVPLTLIVSAIILWFYRRAVKRLMLASAGQTASPPSAEPRSAPPPSQALEFATIGAEDAFSRALAGPWRSFLVYALAGIGFAASMSFIYLQAIGSPFGPWKFALLALDFAWPLVLVWGLVAAMTWRDWLLGVAVFAAVRLAYTAAFFALVPESDRPGLTPMMMLAHWALANLEITLLAPLILFRPIRAIGPLVFVAMAAGAAGATALLSGVGMSDALLLTIVEAAMAVGLGGHQLFYLIMALGAAAGVLLGWLLLKEVGGLYQARYISDQSLIVDSVWLLYASLEAIQRLFDGSYWWLATFVPFLVFKLVCWVGFRLMANSGSPPLHLLLLRVFALGKRSDALFRAIAKPWRHQGAMRMIAGPDLITTTVEPHEILDYVGRKLARRFVKGPEALAAQLAALAAGRDGDGRYRVDELFCHEDTWIMALKSLIAQDHAVLMDLRSFSPDNKGCVVEIRELLNNVPLDRIVFVVDKTTGEAFLKSTFLEAWADLESSSPNRAAAQPRVRLFHLPAINRRAIGALVAAIGQPFRPEAQKQVAAAAGADWQPLRS